MFELFDSIGNWIETLVNDIQTTLDITGAFIGKIGTYLGVVLPESVASVLLIGFSVAILYKVLGREG